MVKYIIAADITAALFILVPIFSMYITAVKPTNKNRAFKLCLWVCFFGLVFNALSYILSGRITSDIIVGTCNYIAFVLVDALVVAYSIYFYFMVNERGGKLPIMFLYIISTLCIIDFIFLTIGTIIGKLFYINNGVYVGGPWWDLSPIVPSICLGLILITLFINFKRIGKVYGIALISYVLLVTITAILQLIDVNIELSYVGSAFALLIIYVMIQSRTVHDTTEKAKLYNELSTLDSLTGLKNRRAYQNEIKMLSGDESVSTVFCDLNNLKLVNDTLGHECGDQYIIKFAEIIIKKFPNDFLCRISGDEFVILIKNIDSKTLEIKMHEFADIISKNNDIASFGYSTGTANTVDDTVKKAEQLMYIEKEKYYERTGKIRRDFSHF